MEESKRKADQKLKTCRKRIRVLEENVKSLTDALKNISKENKSLLESLSNKIDAINSNTSNASSVANNVSVVEPTKYVEWKSITVSNSFNEKFKLNAIETSGNLILHYPESDISLRDIVQDLDEIFDRIVKNGLSQTVQPQDFVKVNISSSSLDNDITVPFVKYSNFDSSSITAEILRVNQSKKEFLFTSLVRFSVTHISMPFGGGKRYGRYQEIDFNTWKTKARTVIAIERDELCCARAIVVGMAAADGMKGSEWKAIRNYMNSVQKSAALSLCEAAGVVAFEKCGIPELMKFDKYLKENNYQLYVADGSSRKNFYFVGSRAEKAVYILYGQNHYDAMSSILQFLQASYFCRFCAAGSKTRYSHLCENKCDSCFANFKCENDDPISCIKCHRTFKNKPCMIEHLNNSICETYWKCLKCWKIIKGRKHQCFLRKCLTCKEEIFETEEHHCYIKPIDPVKLYKDDARRKIFVFYDFESCLEQRKDCVYEHFPNLCVAQVVCDNCWDRDTRIIKTTKCSFCKEGKKVFYGHKAAEDFCIWIFSTFNSIVYNLQSELQLKYTINVYAMAHNAKSYDLQFILKYLVNNNRIPDVTRNGTKLYKLQYGRFIFLDSLNFIPIPLKKLPKTFGCKSSLKKGWFPYLFNTHKNFDYCGPWPSKQLYDSDNFDSYEKIMFDDWYETVKEGEFNLQHELISYCEMDVKILSECVMYFRDLCVQSTTLDPFTRTTTTPMSCMEVYRTFYLKPFDICIIPSIGLEPQRKSSFLGNSWLDYIILTQELTIDKEVKIGRYYADGFDALNRTAYEFFGCIFHGCKTCYPINRHEIVNPVNHKSMIALYEDTSKKLEFYESIGIKCEVQWECAFNLELKRDKRLAKFMHDRRLKINSLDVKPPLNPRDAFFGGRVNALKLYYDAKEGEVINYLDFTSLYPYINKYGKYPRGRPIIIKSFENTDIENFYGLISCKVLPPTDLYIPVLPQRFESKLLFPLCRTCMEKRHPSDCCHTDEERVLVGTWWSDELRVAINYGYRIVEIYEIWHFKEFRQINCGKDGGLFEEFQNKFIKLKVENSGLPKENMSEEEIDEYINEYMCVEGIQLEKEKLVFNPGLRTLGKFMCTSHWGEYSIIYNPNKFYFASGKFSQRSNFRNTQFFKNPSEFFQLLENPMIRVVDAYTISPSVIMVTHERVDDCVVDSAHSNIIIGAVTTSLARLKLLEVLMSLNDRVLYFDTDSVIFVTRPGDIDPPTGDYLGQLTDEVKGKFGDGAFISRFLSGGPKNYTLEIKNRTSDLITYDCKIKGIALNFKSKQIVNFEEMKKVILEEHEALTVPQRQFKVDPHLNIFTNYIDKKYRFGYDKRRIVANFDTLPFGFKQK